MQLPAELFAVTVDCPDPGELARFYQSFLGGRVSSTNADFVVLDGTSGRIDFQRASNREPDEWPSPGASRRVHLDFRADDLAVSEQRLLDLGARLASHQPGGNRFRVLIDPAGHAFCVTSQAGSAVAPPEPTFIDDVRTLARALCSGVAELNSARWVEPAGSLSWTRWETAEHVADDLLVYAATLAVPEYPDDIPFTSTRRSATGPDELVHCETRVGGPGLAAVIQSSARLFVAIAEATADDVVVSHVYGDTGAAGFAAMAAVELLVHGHDLFTETEIEWKPDDRLSRRVLTRLFPDVETPENSECFDILLWATGRTALPGRPRRTEWRWYN